MDSGSSQDFGMKFGRLVSTPAVYRDGVASPGAVSVILSGNRARTVLTGQSLRFAALDGRLEDLAANPPAALVPWISDNWQKVSPWKWAGPIPDAERRKIRDLVAQAHAPQLTKSTPTCFVRMEPTSVSSEDALR